VSAPVEQRTFRKVDIVEQEMVIFAFLSVHARVGGDDAAIGARARPDRRARRSHLRSSDGGDRLWLLSVVGAHGGPHPSTRDDACYHWADLATFPYEETDGTHVDGPSKTGWTFLNTLPG